MSIRNTSLTRRIVYEFCLVQVKLSLRAVWTALKVTFKFPLDKCELKSFLGVKCSVNLPRVYKAPYKGTHAELSASQVQGKELYLNISWRT